MNQEIMDQVMAKIPTGQMRRREVEKLLLQIVESLYLVNKETDRAVRGTISDVGGQPVIMKEDGESDDLYKYLPHGESGTLIWIRGDVEKITRGISEV